MGIGSDRASSTESQRPVIETSVIDAAAAEVPSVVEKALQLSGNTDSDINQVVRRSAGYGAQLTLEALNNAGLLSADFNVTAFVEAIGAIDTHMGAILGEQEHFTRLADDQPSLDEELRPIRAEMTEDGHRLLECIMQGAVIIDERGDKSEQVAVVKHRRGADVYQPGQWSEVLEEAHIFGATIGMKPETVDKIYDFMHELSIERQEAMLANLSKETEA